MIPTGRLEDVEMSHLDELRQTELYGMFVVRKHLVFQVPFPLVFQPRPRARPGWRKTGRENARDTRR